jgi:hypothetical protein
MRGVDGTVANMHHLFTKQGRARSSPLVCPDFAVFLNDTTGVCQ